MLVYRIVHKKYNDYLFAPGLPARWNGAGKKVLYCAESVPLAFMESMIRRQGAGFNDDYNVVAFNIPDRVKVAILDISKLTGAWRKTNNYASCQLLGNAWYDAFETPVLKVPSAVIPTSYNYVLNTLHTDFKKISIDSVSRLVPDERIDDLLKKGRA